MIDKEYIDQITDIISILHDLKHEGKLPKELETWRNWIECFDPNKIVSVYIKEKCHEKDINKLKNTK